MNNHFMFRTFIDRQLILNIYLRLSTQLRHVKMLDSLHFIRKSSVIAQKKRIIMEKKVPSSQIFLLFLILSILRKTFFLRHFDDVIAIKT